MCWWSPPPRCVWCPEPVPKHLYPLVALLLTLLGLVGSAVSSLIEIKTDIATIQAELKYLHGDVQVPKGHGP